MNNLNQSLNIMIQDIVDYLWQIYKIKPIRIRIYDNEFFIEWIIGSVYYAVQLMYNKYDDDFIIVKYRNYERIDSYQINHLDAVFDQIKSIIYYIKPRMVY